jgi:hypothetical protein
MLAQCVVLIFSYFIFALGSSAVQSGGKKYTPHENGVVAYSFPSGFSACNEVN